MRACCCGQSCHDGYTWHARGTRAAALRRARTVAVTQGMQPALPAHLAHRYSPPPVVPPPGDHDTPELIWTHAMRRGRLLPALAAHLGDLPLRLAQRCGAVWDYAPLPPLSYPELDGEVYCHRYGATVESTVDRMTYVAECDDEQVAFGGAVLAAVR